MRRSERQPHVIASQAGGGAGESKGVGGIAGPRAAEGRCASASEQQLLEWAWRHGAGPREVPVRPALCPESGCRGMVATRTIAESETILSIPRSLFMSADSALECPLLVDLLARARNAGQCLCERQILAVHLLLERHKGVKSKWRTFISSIPTEYSTLEYWRDADVEVWKCRKHRNALALSHAPTSRVRAM